MSINNNSNDDNDTSEQQDHKKKRLVLIRHGRTYMNEYLDGRSWNEDGFTDIFDEEAGHERYRDSPLSPNGINQAQELGRRLLQEDWVSSLDLVVVSPLTRTLQTAQLGLFPSLTTFHPTAPPIVVALPYAAERCYFISDVGRPISDNQWKARFPQVNFDDASFVTEEEGTTTTTTWWFSLLEDGSVNYALPGTVTMKKRPYSEWRPTANGQKYAYVGEPKDHFDHRMGQLVDWIDSRPEQMIALVCHWGVIDWLIGEDFDNCEIRIVDFEKDVKARQR